MRTSLDCFPCFVRQSLEAARMVSSETAIHERIIRDVLRWTSELDMNVPPPVLAQRIHRRLKELTNTDDPYRSAKEKQNLMALNLLAELKAELESSPDPLLFAARLATAGNAIDMGVNGTITESDVRASIRQALTEPFCGSPDEFRNAVAEARSILYLADNAGEIVFDRLLIEHLYPVRVTLAVRGAPILNDVTLDDIQSVGLSEIVTVITNGSDAPGTILEDCSPEFQRCFAEADLIVSKGQGNFETLSDYAKNIFFLFKAKCPVIASLIDFPLGTHVLMRIRRQPTTPGGEA